mmetsp:Transcript_40711/g.64037  ORF Transcript_40711/g.64037 Transcript_40711/m.64037 type:complete len:118 (+) Transcript_40711:235-588(+)
MRPGLSKSGCQPGIFAAKPCGHMIGDHCQQVMISAKLTQALSEFGQYPGTLGCVVHEFVPETEGDGINHYSAHWPPPTLYECSKLLYGGIEFRGVVSPTDMEGPHHCLQLRSCSGRI